MQCARCQAENPPESPSCSHCGTQLLQRCPQCQEPLPLTAKFCILCGHPLGSTLPVAAASALTPELEAQPLATDPVSASQPSLPSSQEEAERRQLTVMFCDLVGSTALSVQLDPEDFHDVVRAYQETCGVVVNRFVGSIAQYLGDGVLVYFGYPQAHEDDAQRAVRAGLEIIQAVGRLNTRLEAQWGVRISARVGIDTGLVVVAPVGNEGRSESMALGESLNLAARLQAIAAPDTVVISAASYRLVQGYFACEALGDRRLEGFEEPVSIYRVLHESQVRNRFDVATARGLTPLVSREREVDLLLTSWQEVKHQGAARVVLINGEAGIGKSRLLQTLQERIADQPYTRLECRCFAYHQNSALYPIIDLCHRRLRFRHEETAETQLRKLERALSRLHLPVDETLPLVAALLSLPLPARCQAPDLSLAWQKQKIMELFVAVLTEMAGQQPVLFVVEDLHWIDPSSLDLLTFAMDRLAASSVLMLFTSRLPLPAVWDDRPNVTRITLARLSQGQMDRMIQQVAGGRTLPKVVRQQLIAQTDGVPLFVEELTKMVLESGLLEERNGRYRLSGPLPPLAIPSTLQDSLMARLDRLSTGKAVAQLGAVLGRQFSYELLHAATSLDESVLAEALEQLVQAELLYRHGSGAQARYVFKHALIQEAAYQSLLKRSRQRHHQQIAQVLETRFAEVIEMQPELVAYHHTEAGQPEQALRYWQVAGQRALERSAHIEAIAHLTRGLAVLKTLPDAAQRVRQELSLLLALGATLMTVRGFAAPEVESTYARARTLCQRMGDAPQLFPALIGLWRFYFTRAELETAQDLAEQLLRLAQQTDDSARLLGAYNTLGATLFFQAELNPAHTYLEQGIALYDTQQHRTHTLRSGLDSGAICLGFDAWALWILGYPDQALARSRDALELTHALNHPFSLAWSLFFATGLHQLRREARAVREQAEAMMRVSTEQEFPVWLALATMFHGWALAVQAEGEEGIAQMRQGLQMFRDTGAEVLRPLMLALLADTYGNLGRVTEGLYLLDEALAVIEKTQERWWAAELHRLQGELLLRQGPDHKVEAAEASLHQALDLARRQQARSWELRAAMSLSRLWLQQGNRERAYSLLHPTYHSFTEGFDTADLIEAERLLATSAAPM